MVQLETMSFPLKSVRHFSASIPCVTLKTGMSGKAGIRTAIPHQSRGRPICSSAIGYRNSWKRCLDLEQGQSNLCRARIFPTHANYQGSGNYLLSQLLPDPLPTPSKSNSFRPTIFRVGRDSAEAWELWRGSGFR